MTDGMLFLAAWLSIIAALFLFIYIHRGDGWLLFCFACMTFSACCWWKMWADAMRREKRDGG